MNIDSMTDWLTDRLADRLSVSLLFADLPTQRQKGFVPEPACSRNVNPAPPTVFTSTFDQKT